MTPIDKADLEGLIHDLNNVFQTVGESAELLHSDPKWVKLAGTLQRSVEHGKRLARTILESNRAVADPAWIVGSAVQFARDYLECVQRPSLVFTQRIEESFRLAGDPAAWERVLVNLFLNAAEAGATQVGIETKDGGLVIWDDGSGIPSDLLPRIFDAHVSSKAILSGLGLYVVRSLVEQNGGHVSAGNRTQGGAEFRIRLNEPANA